MAYEDADINSCLLLLKPVVYLKHHNPDRTELCMYAVADFG